MNSEPALVDVQPNAYLTYLIAKVEHRLSLRLDRALGVAGITLTQFCALANIGANPGITSGALARALLVTPQAVATLIKRLSSAGLIHQQNQRTRGLPGSLWLTPAGGEALLRAADIAQSAEERNLIALTKPEQAIVFDVLTKLHDSLDE